MVTRGGPADTPLAQARRTRRLRQEDVAKAVGIGRTFYTHIERGTKKPSLAVALRIARFFGSDVTTLFQGDVRSDDTD